MDSGQLEDWGQIILICPCHIKEAKECEDIRKMKDMTMKMVNGYRNVNFQCPYCTNSFDYEVKIKLFELLNKYFQNNQTYVGFNKYVSRKGERIRLRYIKEMKTNTGKAIIIEAANLTQHPSFKNS